MEGITSKENSKFKLAKSLLSRKHREKEGLCIIEGERLVNHVRAIRPESIKMIFVNALSMHLLKTEYPQAITLADSLFNELADTVHSQGVIAIAAMMDSTGFKPFDFRVALDGIQDPGNLGTIIRTIDAVGSTDLILSKGCVDLYNPKVLRSAMGSLFDIGIERNKDLAQECELLKADRYEIVGAALENSVDLMSFVWKPKTVLIIGNEGNGISDSLLKVCDVLVKIPLMGRAESLNAAVATGILLYDAHRNLRP